MIFVLSVFARYLVHQPIINERETWEAGFRCTRTNAPFVWVHRTLRDAWDAENRRVFFPVLRHELACRGPGQHTMAQWQQ